FEVDGMEINIPPREDRENNSAKPGGTPALNFSDAKIRNARLVILTKKPGKEPLEFNIRTLDLNAADEAGVVQYKADLTNPKPPGDITSEGSFGPWDKENPGATSLAGSYEFNNADLGVFTAIAGILHSTGTFQGALSTITAKGEATVPDFRL